MRIDLFLKITRLIARRTLAQEFCDAGLIRVNGGVAKSSKEIKAGDEIEIKRRNRLTKVVVTKVPTTKQVSKDSVDELYRVVEETTLEESI